MWPFKQAESASAFIGAQQPDNVILVGTIKGKGIIYRGSIEDDTAGTLYYKTHDTSTMTVNASGGIVTVSGPTGGMSQFKGLTQSSNQDLYVQTICLSIQPMYTEVWLNNLIDGIDNGWVLSCYTGIPQCAVSLVDAITILDNTTST